MFLELIVLVRIVSMAEEAGGQPSVASCWAMSRRAAAASWVAIASTSRARNRYRSSKNSGTDYSATGKTASVCASMTSSKPT